MYFPTLLRDTILFQKVVAKHDTLKTYKNLRKYSECIQTGYACFLDAFCEGTYKLPS